VVADDEPALRRFIGKALSREQFQVFEACDGQEAAALVAAHPCGLLVIDLAMPGGEGIETIRAVRQQYPQLKILAISGAFGEDILHDAEALGADASLAKPFTASALLAAVRALLEPVKSR
jgi:DNA-binding response OmpR family regulator